MKGTKRSWAYSWVCLSAILIMVFLSACAVGRPWTSIPRKVVGPAPPGFLGQETLAQGLKSSRNAITTKEPDAVTQVRASETYGKLPLSFEANQGQTNKQVKFLSRGSGYALFLTSTEAVLALKKPRAAAQKGHFPLSPLPNEEKVKSEGQGTVLRMKLVGANSTPRAAGLEALPGKSNYFIGNDPKKWRTNVPTYARVQYQNIYPGVNLVYYGNQRQLEYDFVVAPGADPKAIKLAFEGAQELHTDAQGNLVLLTKGGEILLQKPLVYQEINGTRREIPGHYVLQGKDNEQVGFQVAAYDPARPLVIDPVLVYSTYLGGSGDDYSEDIAVDASGNAYVTGFTASFDFPTTVGAFDTSVNNGDVFVAKLSSDGSALLYATFLGGNDRDSGWGIALDAASNAYVTGVTQSSDFPTTAGAFDTSFNGGNDVFVAKLSSDGSALLYATFLGGSIHEEGMDIAVDAYGNAYVTGVTQSFSFPTTVGAFDTSFNGVGYDAFVAKLSNDGSTLLYSTFLGGSGFAQEDVGWGIALDAAGNAYVMGRTQSSNFPTTIGAFDTSHNGGNDIFVAKLSNDGSTLLYSTFLGGSGDDDYGLGGGIALDAAGNAYVTGGTFSYDFPTTVGAFDTGFNNGDAFVAKLSNDGSTLLYSTFLGGSNDDVGYGIALDGSGNAYVTGYTNSSDFPTANPLQRANRGSSDGFVVKLNPVGSTLVYSTYIGGSGFDYGCCIAADAQGSAYVTGHTNSINFPTVNPLQLTFGGGLLDAFTVKIATSPNSTPVANDDSKSIMEDTALIFSASDLTINDTDPDGDSLTVTAVTATATASTHGTVTLSGGIITYALEANFNGLANFSYTISDGNGGTATATVTITVTSVNDPPSFDPIADQSAAEDASSQNVTIAGVSPGPADEAGQTVTLTATSSNTAIVPNPTVLAVSAGSATLTYRPAANANGTVTITVTANDGQAQNNTFSRTFTITVTPVNDPPTIASFTATPSSGTAPLPVTFSVAASDIDGTITSVRWDFDGDGTVDQTTTTLSTSFTYATGGRFTARVTVIDNEGARASATASVSVADFVLSGSPSAQDVSPGGSATYAISVTSLFGFTAPVTLSVSGVPSSSTATFTPNPINPSGTAFLTVNTAAATPVGTYPLTITGTSGTLTRVASVTLAVTTAPQAADFFLLATPSSQSAVQGAASLSTEISVLSLNGFASPVNLSISGLPPAVTASFSSNPVTPTGLSQLTVTLSSATPTGSYPLTITGVSGTLSHTSSVTLTVISPPLSGNTPLSDGPVGVSIGDGVTTTFSAVTSAGTTSVITSTTGPPPPTGFRLAGTYYAITTDATFVSPVVVCISYADSPNEQNFRLLHREGTTWLDVTSPGYPDIAANIICGEVTSFSEFAVMEIEPIISGGGQSSTVDQFLTPVAVFFQPSGQVQQITERVVAVPPGTTRIDVSFDFGPGAIPSSLDVTFNRVQVLAPGSVPDTATGVIIRGLGPLTSGHNVLVGIMAGSLSNARDRDRLTFVLP